jgi:tRNA (guanine37-N1)-methyltransferase
LVCGRFEGFDERIRSYIDEEISIGDYVLLGGEIAALVIIEAVSRLIPGVIGNQASLEKESFSGNVLEYAQYTKPFEFRGQKVPDILISGNHQKVDEWREKNSQARTNARRNDLLKQNV